MFVLALERTYGPSHETALRASEAIISLLGKLQKYEESAELARKQFVLARCALGKDHATTRELASLVELGTRCANRVEGDPP